MAKGLSDQQKTLLWIISEAAEKCSYTGSAPKYIAYNMAKSVLFPDIYECCRHGFYLNRPVQAYEVWGRMQLSHYCINDNGSWKKVYPGTPEGNKAFELVWKQRGNWNKARATISRSVARLEARGLITCNRSYITLTDKGKQMAATLTVKPPSTAH